MRDETNLGGSQALRPLVINTDRQRRSLPKKGRALSPRAPLVTKNRAGDSKVHLRKKGLRVRLRLRLRLRKNETFDEENDCISTAVEF